MAHSCNSFVSSAKLRWATPHFISLRRLFLCFVLFQAYCRAWAKFIKHLLCFLAISAYSFPLSLPPSVFFFFNDVFADKTASVCKQLQNEIGIFNLLMGFSHVSKKVKLSVALELLVSFFSPAFLLLPLKHRLNGILDAQLSVILWITLWLWLAWHFWFLNL